MKDDQYPSLFQSANAASVSAQKTYFLLQRAHLGSLMLGSILGASTTLATNLLGAWVFTVLAIILALSLLILWVNRSRQEIGKLVGSDQDKLLS